MALTKQVDLQIPQGATYKHVITYLDETTGLPVDITGYTARMQFREYIEATTTLYVATTATGEFVVDGPNGKVYLTIPATDTATFTFTECIYDVEIESPTGVVVRLIKGSVILDPEVTR